MMADPVQLFPLNSNFILGAGKSQVAIYAGVKGGRLYNPPQAYMQNLPETETLFYSFAGPATPYESATTFPLQPGQQLDIPADMTTDLHVCAASGGHRFSGYIIQPPIQPTPTPVPAVFPPSAPTTLQQVIKSYLYVQYQDDDDLQAWVRSYNENQQEYVDLFNQVIAPLYTLDIIQGALLDWIAKGLYGMIRPTLASGQNNDIGPYNTVLYNELEFNGVVRAGSQNVAATTDDIFKRIMTWRLYRGDGKIFTPEWLKRRIKRFLYGENGTDVVISETYDISVTYDGTDINILLPALTASTILKDAIDSGAVELPFQYTYNVTVTGA